MMQVPILCRLYFEGRPVPLARRDHKQQESKSTFVCHSDGLLAAAPDVVSCSFVQLG